MKATTTPAVSRPEWVGTPVDAFILARLDRAGLAPSPEADRHTLIRRATSISPACRRLPGGRAFQKDGSPGAYERLIDRLLGSPRYGERLGAALAGRREIL
ncbi:MAG: DUF1549 domain-containing protein [Isosphaeraceae bacterium]